MWLFPVLTQAQWQRTMHHSFPLPDSARVLHVDLPWSYSTAQWVNNSLLVEITVRMENGSEGLLKSAVDNERYGTSLEYSGDSCRLSSVLKVFPPLQTARGQVQEVLNVRIFLPAEFSSAGVHFWSRPEKRQPE